MEKSKDQIVSHVFLHAAHDHNVEGAMWCAIGCDGTGSNVTIHAFCDVGFVSTPKGMSYREAHKRAISEARASVTSKGLVNSKTLFLTNERHSAEGSIWFLKKDPNFETAYEEAHESLKALKKKRKQDECTKKKAKPRTVSQASQVLEYLKAGNSLTSMEAIGKFRCSRLASRISELKQKGYAIQKTMVKQGNARVAEYWLAGLDTLNSAALG